MKILVILLGITALMTGCSDKREDSAQAADAGVMSREVKIARNVDFAQISKGGQLYQKNCAVCHGQSAGGAPNWRRRDSKNKFPPPPLNGSGHAWHHPSEALKSVIRNGTQKIGGNMPPWKETLSDSDMDAIIAWFQSKWSDEVYTAWYEIEQRSKR